MNQTIFNHRLHMAALSVRDSVCNCDDIPHHSGCEWFSSRRSLEMLVSENPTKILKLLHMYDWAQRAVEMMKRDE